MKINFKNKLIIFFGIYILFRFFIFNINSAEWGDSYRILRATSSIENGSYPKDEKRPPLYSAFLTFIPNNVDQILGGRVLMIFIGLGCVYTFYILLNQLNLNLTENQKLLSLILFAYNPLFIYWNMRIYADTFFLLICLIAFIIYIQILKTNSLLKIFLLSFVSFLGIMTRFEGYLLISALTLGFVFEFIRKRDKRILINLTIFLLIGFCFFIWAINTPWTFFKNPISSSYVDEANRRFVGFYDVLGYFLNLSFILGNLFTLYFVFFDKKRLFAFIKENFVLFNFLMIELMLAFIWPAAVPRLMVQIIPILVILMVLGLDSFYKKGSVTISFVFPLAIAIYLFGQYLVKSQFLLTNYFFMAVIVFISLIQILFIYKKNYRLFEFSLILVTVIWMGLFVYLHKDIYKVLNTGVVFFSQQYQKDGIIVTNDVSALSKFYFSDNLKYLREVDFGIDIQKYLQEKNAKYIIITNEHNPDMEFSPSKYPYLETIYEHREEVNGRKFFVVISKVNIK